MIQTVTSPGKYISLELYDIGRGC